MTVGMSIKCSDGIVLACDSLTTFSRGSPVKRFANKAYTINHSNLLYPVAAVGAGMTAFLDKFIDTANREAISNATTKPEQKLDIIDFCTDVCEPLVCSLFKRYGLDRNRFFEAPISDFSLSLIVAGATKDKALRSFFVHADGVTENISDYGTIGSGAAYAEFFLNALLSDEKRCCISEAVPLSVYAVKGVEMMDPNVGGKTNVLVMKMDNDSLNIQQFPTGDISDKATQVMKDVLAKLNAAMREQIQVEQLQNGG